MGGGDVGGGGGVRRRWRRGGVVGILVGLVGRRLLRDVLCAFSLLFNARIVRESSLKSKYFMLTNA